MTDQPARTDGEWTFHDFGNEFDDHVTQHLPGYLTVQNIVADLARYTAYNGGVVADLGASTGTTARLIRDTVPNREIEFVLYDEDRSMLDVAAEKLSDANVRTVETDLTTQPLEHDSADLTLLLWVLQFMHPKHRIDVLAAARAAAAESGAILIACKTMHQDVRWQDIADNALDEFKERQGVDTSTRLAKTRSLRGTMVPDTVNQTMTRLKDAGWYSPAVLWSMHQWALIGAFASPLD